MSDDSRYIARYWAGLREPDAELRFAQALRAVPVGLATGLHQIIAIVALASIVFSGALAPHAAGGIGLLLFGNSAACLVFAAACGYRGAIAGLSPATVAAMAALASAMDLAGDALFVTTVGALAISAVATGVFCLMIGRWRLANVFRFIPYPVAGGVVASVGAAVCLAALSLLGVEPHWSAVPTLLEPATLLRWGPGTAYGIVLYLAMKRWKSVLLLPLSAVFAIAGVHLALLGLGISGDEARSGGLLLAGAAHGRLWPPLSPADLAHLDWTAMADQIPGMLVLMLTAFIAITVNIGALELAADWESDWDREFRVTGVATVIAGLGGGGVANLNVSGSYRSKLFGATTRVTGFVAAITVASAWLLGGGLLELIPTALVGGMLIPIGLGLMDEALVKSRARIPWSEYAIIVMIFVVFLLFGLLAGVGAGALAALVFLAVRLSHVDPIESRSSARECRSSAARSIPDRAILHREGEHIHTYRLRGYLFFGSARVLADRLRSSLASRPACLMLDCSAVSGWDISAVRVLAGLLRAADEAGVQAVLSAPSRALRTGLERNLPTAVFSRLHLESNDDLALERCEDIVIEAWTADTKGTEKRRAELLEHVTDDLEHHLVRQMHFEELVEALSGWLTPRQFAAKEALAGSGTPRQGLQLLLAGRASVYDERGARLRQLSAGDAIWPAGSPDGNAASVLADEPCRTMELTPAARDVLDNNEERLALKLYRYLFAGRLRATGGPPAARTPEDTEARHGP